MKLLITFLLFSFSYAYNIKSVLTVEKGSLQWVEGQTREVKLLIWPIDELDSKYLTKELEGKDFLDHFFVSKVNSASFSKNNPQAFEVYLNLTLKEFFTRSKILIWRYKALNIPVEIDKNIVIEKDPKKLQDFIVFDNNTIKNVQGISYKWILIPIILLITLIPFGLRIYKKNKAKKEKIEEANKWISKLNSAEKRKDFEFLYSHKDIWIESVFGTTTPSINDFLEEINKHQYKKKWSNEEYNAIAHYYDDLKESLS